MNGRVRKTILWKGTPVAGATAAGLISTIILTLAGKALIGAAEPSASAFRSLQRVFALAMGMCGAALLVGAISATCFLLLSRLRLRTALSAPSRPLLTDRSCGGPQHGA